jgi:hypothetical protein
MTEFKSSLTTPAGLTLWRVLCSEDVERVNEAEMRPMVALVGRCFRKR